MLGVWTKIDFVNTVVLDNKLSHIKTQAKINHQGIIEMSLILNMQYRIFSPQKRKRRPLLLSRRS